MSQTAQGESGLNESGGLAGQVIGACLAMGFARAGIAPALPTNRRAEYLAWLAAGEHGEMTFMEELLEERLDITRMLPGAKSVILVADQYAARGDFDDEVSEDANPRGRIARYARGHDYHRVIKSRLHQLANRLRGMHPGHEFRSFVDTGPVMEREHAERTLLGADAQGHHGAFIGKHTLLIDPALGSYLLLGGMVTTLDLVQSAAPRSLLTASMDHCGTCTKCIDACPTAAITQHHVDARKCVSYLTIEHSGRIDPVYFMGVGDRLIGCDVCQDVCPFNAPSPGHEREEAARVNAMYHNPERRAFDLREVLRWTEEDRRRELAGSAGKRVSLEMIRRNAVIAAGNAGMLDEVRDVAGNEAESDLVRSTACDVLIASNGKKRSDA